MNAVSVKQIHSSRYIITIVMVTSAFPYPSLEGENPISIQPHDKKIRVLSNRRGGGDGIYSLMISVIPHPFDSSSSDCKIRLIFLAAPIMDEFNDDDDDEARRLRGGNGSDSGDEDRARLHIWKKENKFGKHMHIYVKILLRLF